MKKLIINADDFGISEETNIAIKQGFDEGIITSTSLIANMDAFNHAVFEILPTIQNIDTGFHFNIAEGKSLTNQPLLCDENGFFNRNYVQLIMLSFRKEFIKQVEIEFRAQLEKVLQYCKISHIDSHMHTHAIPNIFNVIAKLAKEYNIPYIRSQKEIPYIVWKKSFNTKFLINILKNILLGLFTTINKKNEIKTNDYFIGILYTGFMDTNSIIKGLNKINKDDSITEVIFHPTIDESKTHNYKEFLITKNPSFKDFLQNSGFSQSTFYDN